MRWWARRRPLPERCPACEHPWEDHAGGEDDPSSSEGDVCEECRYEIATGAPEDLWRMCRLRAHHSRVQALLASLHIQLAGNGPATWFPPTPQWRTARVEFHLDDGRPVSLWEDDDTLKVVVDHRFEFLVDDDEEQPLLEDARGAVLRLLVPLSRSRRPPVTG